MTSMIERWAEAMRARRRELIAQPLDRIWPELMKAALIAMREPTEEMVRMGMTALPNSTPGRHQKTGWVYNAMIDAALKEQP